MFTAGAAGGALRGCVGTLAARTALNQIIAQEADASLLAAARNALQYASLNIPGDLGTTPAP